MPRVEKMVIDLYTRHRDPMTQLFPLNHTQCWVFLYLFACNVCKAHYGQSGNHILTAVSSITRSVNSVDKPRNLNRASIYPMLDYLVDKGFLRKMTRKEMSVANGRAKRRLVGNPGKDFYTTSPIHAIMKQFNDELDQKKVTSTPFFDALVMLEEADGSGDGK